VQASAIELKPSEVGTSLHFTQTPDFAAFESCTLSSPVLQEPPEVQEFVPQPSPDPHPCPDSHAIAVADHSLMGVHRCTALQTEKITKELWKYWKNLTNFANARIEFLKQEAAHQSFACSLRNWLQLDAAVRGNGRTLFDVRAGQELGFGSSPLDVGWMNNFIQFDDSVPTTTRMTIAGLNPIHFRVFMVHYRERERRGAGTPCV
jgi:hypothetical protein